MHDMKLIHIQQFQINMLFFICVSSSNFLSYEYFYIQRSHLVSVDNFPNNRFYFLGVVSLFFLRKTALRIYRAIHHL